MTRSRASAKTAGRCVVLELTPPAELINANQRLHFRAKADLTKAWREGAWANARMQRRGFRGLPFPRAHITVAYRFPDNRRREVSNLQPTSKAIVDGLVDAGLIPDDDDQHVIGPDNRRDYPNGPLRVTVTIQEQP